MKKQFHLIISLASALLLMASCGEESSFDKGYKASVTGKSGEVLFVVEDFLWEGPVGDTLRKIFTQPIPQLPQYEEMFGIRQIDPQNFDRLVESFRNIVEVKVGDNINYKDGLLQIQKDRYSKGQAYVTIGATTNKKLYALLRENAEKIVERINTSELAHTQEYFRKFGNDGLEKKVADKYNLKMLLPERTMMVKETEDFFWIKRDLSRKADQRMHEIMEGFFMYSFPYTDPDTFTREYLLAKRDSITKEHIAGPSEDSYMTTVKEISPDFRSISLNGKYAAELRGLWETENDFMGGPFVSIATLDEARNRVVVLEGYVYALRFRNDEYMREVEASIKSLEIL